MQDERRRAEVEGKRAEVRAGLVANGRDHLRITAEHLGAVRDEDVSAFVKEFVVDKVLRDDEGIYVTFRDGGTARRAERVLGGGMLGFHAVTLSVHPPPAADTGAGPADVWDDDAMIRRAGEMVARELRELLEKDITDRIVGPHLRNLAAERRAPGREREREGEGERGHVAAKRDLKTMSFKKAKKEAEVEVPAEEHEEEREEETVIVERPKKKRKKEATKKVLEEDEEPGEVWAGQRRLASEEEREEGEEEEEQPSRKKLKLEHDAAVVKKASKKKKVPEKKRKPSVEEVVLPEEYDAPAVTDLRLSSGFESSLSPSRSPSPSLSEPPPRLPTPPPNVLDEGICDDDEDIYYAKLVLSGLEIEPTLDLLPPPSETAPFFRKHITGSARTEGFYKITHAEKIAYVTQYQARRANARRRAQGLEEIN
ncbi:hypothetical protein C8R47DRAFT_729150 [Mycena vitilis]|nr:hypothetical protein C8R47DRAFT_729150 [Mycena vitilis]